MLPSGHRLAAANCSEEWFEQPISHFSWAPPPGGRSTYKQRYFVCLGNAKGPAPPVFFYFGNEDNVELYVEHTGIMWETAPDMGAALVFLEHRYYGLSLPFAPKTPGVLLHTQRHSTCTHTPTLSFLSHTQTHTHTHTQTFQHTSTKTHTRSQTTNNMKNICIYI